jgi:hypothetical protein
MEIEIVRPANGRSESLALFVAVLIVLAVFGATVLLRNKTVERKPLLDYQINGFKDLSSFEQGTYNDLYASTMEIIGAYEDNDYHWPTVSELSEQYISPFIQDQAWKARGKLAWKREIIVEKDMHAALYLGTTSDESISGSFLLAMSFQNQSNTPQKNPFSLINQDMLFKIWYQKGSNVLFPRKTDKQNLIMKGWKEIVPYRGEDEIDRLKE